MKKTIRFTIVFVTIFTMGFAQSIDDAFSQKKMPNDTQMDAVLSLIKQNLEE